MGKETRHPSTPRKAPYQAPREAAGSADLLGHTLDLPPTPPHAQHHQHAQPSQGLAYTQQQYLGQPASPAHSSGTSHSVRSSPPRVTPGSSPGQTGQGSTTGPTDSTIDPKLFKLLKHGIISRTFGSDLAKAFFGEIFAVTVNHKERAAAEYRETDTAHYRHIDRAFTRMALWKPENPAVTRAVVDYAANDSCGTIVKYNSEGANWRPPRWFTDRKPGLHWFQGPMGGAGIDLNKCETPELAAQYLRVPEGQAVLCKLSKFSTCHLRIKASQNHCFHHCSGVYADS
ncbi:hypothetical protein PENSPDRAFT_503829 [Peniophora sp. CONT]|nr:hypothetical protein PENSPDRAFT_503829 [Peniophora sp. CONT]